MYQINQLLSKTYCNCGIMPETSEVGVTGVMGAMEGHVPDKSGNGWIAFSPLCWDPPLSSEKIPLPCIPSWGLWYSSSMLLLLPSCPKSSGKKLRSTEGKSLPWSGWGVNNVPGMAEIGKSDPKGLMGEYIWGLFDGRSSFKDRGQKTFQALWFYGFLKYYTKFSISTEYQPLSNTIISLCTTLMHGI